MGTVYRRPDLASEMARQMLRPGVLYEGLRSGLFISGLRRIGKTTFLRNDLIPALEAEGALVIYVDLWSDTRASPSTLVLTAIRKALSDLQSPGSSAWQKIRDTLKRVQSVDIGVGGFKTGFKLDNLGVEGGTTVAQALTEVVDRIQTDIVLIVDEVQHAISSDDGHQMLLALKAARDAINPRPQTPGHFIFIGTGSHRAQISELTARRNQAFAGGTSIDFPVLGRDYIQHLLKRLAEDGHERLPSLAVAAEAFATLGHRPEEMQRALMQLILNLPPGSNPDEHLPVIAATLRSTAADSELMKVEQLGSLAAAIFERIATSDDPMRGLFSADAAASYSKFVGREVRVDEIQPVVNELLAANLIMRRGHGVYVVTDPFVQQLWRERKALDVW